MNCVDCDVPLVSHYKWFTLKQRPAGTAPRGGQGRCRNHYQAWRRAQRHDQTGERRTPDQKNARPSEESLEEYWMIRDSVDTVAQAAERMGMTFSALDMVLYRARKAGDPRGMPPSAQLERGIHYGPARHLVA